VFGCCLRLQAAFQAGGLFTAATTSPALAGDFKNTFAGAWAKTGTLGFFGIGSILSAFSWPPTMIVRGRQL
jgi:hypothetical protein